ncbi:MAG: hypothetical protein AB201_00065 [Parcubacteria bacterium C7867-006]|nr:MAG: hypothetical protein AB201_00065 [Parcubacteria bacterium C7867-006]
MKNIYKNLAKISVSIVLLLFLTNTAYALDDYTVLTPLPGTVSSCTGNNCTTNIDTYLPGMFNLMVGVAAGLAFIMITLGGITYATSDALSGKSQGREWVTNAIVGLLLVIGAYVILYTINPKILEFKIDITEPIITPAQIVTAGVPMTAEQIAESNAIKAELEAAGVTVNAGPCTNGQTSGCTNLNGLPRTAIDGLKTMLSLCKKNVSGACLVKITGGTEPGAHATHGVNKAIVDLRPDVNLNKFILGNSNSPVDKTNKEVSLGGYRYAFTYETKGGNPNGSSTGDHWHVVISKP